MIYELIKHYWLNYWLLLILRMINWWLISFYQYFWFAEVYTFHCFIDPGLWTVSIIVCVRACVTLHIVRVNCVFWCIYQWLIIRKHLPSLIISRHCKKISLRRTLLFFCKVTQRNLSYVSRDLWSIVFLWRNVWKFTSGCRVNWYG